MIKIITAINNPNLNNQLQDEDNIKIIGKDIQYKDAIIDFLNNNQNVDIIIINYNIPSEIDDDKLIKKIKEINENIRIVYLIEKNKKQQEELLKQYGVSEIYDNTLSITEIINIIKDKKQNYLNTQEDKKNELIELKKIIYERKEAKQTINFKCISNLLNNKIKKIINLNKKINENKIITVSGINGVGKTSFILIFSKIINNKKFLIIDFDLKKSNMYSFLGIKKFAKNIKNDNSIKENDFNNFIIKINNNIDLISGLDCIENFNIDFLLNYLNEQKENYDIVFIDIGTENSINYSIIYQKSDINILLVEGNFVGISKTKKYLEKYQEIPQNKIIINKKNKYCVDRKIISEVLGYGIIGSLKYNELYDYIANKNYPKIVNKKIKKDYEKIYQNIGGKKDDK